MKQTSFASLTYDAKKKQTRREKFLAEMEQAVPWEALLAGIDPFYPKAGRSGRQPMALSTMLRIYFMQQWYSLSDPGMGDALYEIESMRRFAGLELVEYAIPDETTILNFRRLLERHQLTTKLMDTLTPWRVAKEWVKTDRYNPPRRLIPTVIRKVRGYNDYGRAVRNETSLWVSSREVMKLLYKWLNRKSQRRSLTCQGLKRVLAPYAFPATTSPNQPVLNWGLA